MNLLESLIKSLMQNTSSMNSLQDFDLRQTISRTINTQPTIQDADIRKKKTEKKSDTGREEFATITGVAGYGAMEIREGMSQEEIMATQLCNSYAQKLKEGGLSLEEENNIKEKYKKARIKLERVRQKYDITGEYISDTVLRANQVIRNLRSPEYISDKKKRKGIFKSYYYGIEDPFYDKLKEIYGDEGLEGYRKERLEAFKKISDEDVKLASKRYTRVKTALTHFKTLAQLGMFVAGCVTLYPTIASGYGNPILAGIGMMAFSHMVFKYPEIKRTSENFNIFSARRKIAEDLGLVEKDKSYEYFDIDNSSEMDK